jgi:hypothetical protein
MAVAPWASGWLSACKAAVGHSGSSSRLCQSCRIGCWNSPWPGALSGRCCGAGPGPCSLARRPRFVRDLRAGRGGHARTRLLGALGLLASLLGSQGLVSSSPTGAEVRSSLPTPATPGFHRGMACDGASALLSNRPRAAASPARPSIWPWVPPAWIPVRPWLVGPAPGWWSPQRRRRCRPTPTWRSCATGPCCCPSNGGPTWFAWRSCGARITSGPCWPPGAWRRIAWPGACCRPTWGGCWW